jgi:hypothetical protein
MGLGVSDLQTMPHLESIIALLTWSFGEKMQGELMAAEGGPHVHVG